MPSVTDLLFQNNTWVLTSLDTGKKIEGQFPPTDLTEAASATYAQTETLGRTQPILQFQGNGPKTIGFTAKAFALHQGILGLGQDTIEDFVAKIKATCNINKDFGRPEIFSFAVGKSVTLASCVVTTVGGISYDRLRPYDGTLRGVSFSIELQEFVQYNTKLTGKKSESLVLPFRENQGFEGLSKQVYGDATPGEALRRRNPKKVIPVVGEVIHLPPKPRLMLGFQLTPQSWAMKDTDTNENARLAYFKDRDRRYTLYNVTWS